jgi:O-antigen ligase
LIAWVLGISGVVALFGVVQYFLPPDILKHVGYSIERGVRPNFFIDDKVGFPRIMSTLREPNALGAYLIVPMTLTVLVWAKVKEFKHKLALIALFALYTLALLWTFSRSAWMGALIAVVLALAWNYHTALLRFVKRFWFVCLIAVLGLGAVAYAQRNTPFVQSYISHTSNDKDIDSNEYHYLFVKQGIEGIINQPLGHGPGTAGLASIQNPQGSFLTENYYVQVGYEVGVIGLALFVGMNALIYVGLWQTRRTVLGTVLLATFWSYVLTNMLLHTWSNEAVACQWWLLAGLVLGAQSTISEKSAATKRNR